MDSSANIADSISAFANIATAIIAAFSAWFGIRIFQHQRTSSDIQLALGIFTNINAYWDRISDTKSSNYQYDMGQIFAHFETAAKLFNDNILTKEALPILKDHIIEVYISVQSTQEGKDFINNCKSSPHTFDELKLFLKRNFPTALLAEQYSMNSNKLII